MQTFDFEVKRLPNTEEKIKASKSLLIFGSLTIAFWVALGYLFLLVDEPIAWVAFSCLFSVLNFNRLTTANVQFLLLLQDLHQGICQIIKTVSWKKPYSGDRQRLRDRDGRFYLRDPIGHTRHLACFLNNPRIQPTKAASINRAYINLDLQFSSQS